MRPTGVPAALVQLTPETLGRLIQIGEGTPVPKKPCALSQERVEKLVSPDMPADPHRGDDEALERGVGQHAPALDQQATGPAFSLVKRRPAGPKERAQESPIVGMVGRPRDRQLTVGINPQAGLSIHEPMQLQRPAEQPGDRPSKFSQTAWIKLLRFGDDRPCHRSACEIDSQVDKLAKLPRPRCIRFVTLRPRQMVSEIPQLGRSKIQARLQACEELIPR